MKRKRPVLPSSVRDALLRRGQERVLAFLDAHPSPVLAAELAGLDWDRLDRQLTSLTQPIPAPPAVMEPPVCVPPALAADLADVQEATALGIEALRAGRVALATVAGGQASRLGFPGPKGAFPLGPVSGASLFQILAGKVARLRQIAGCSVPWLIQTGPANHEATHRFFADRSWFGLGRNTVELFCQGTLPTLSPEGDLLLAGPNALLRNPDGHGGFYPALSKGRRIDRLADAGIDLLFYFQVDNPLARVGDPTMLGFQIAQGAEMGIKVVPKTEPGEKVGLVVIGDGSPVCVEYSDLPPALSELRAEDGRLVYEAGNMALHSFTLDFVRRIAEKADALPFHLARKTVHALDGGLDPVPRDGVKFEAFVFDALPLANGVVVQRCPREEEFAPVKNAQGVDSAATSRAALVAQHRRWADDAGLSEGIPEDGPFEIAPGTALDAEDLARPDLQAALSMQGRLLG